MKPAIYFVLGVTTTASVVLAIHSFKKSKEYKKLSELLIKKIEENQKHD